MNADVAIRRPAMTAGAAPINYRHVAIMSNMVSSRSPWIVGHHAVARAGASRFGPAMVARRHAHSSGSAPQLVLPSVAEGARAEFGGERRFAGRQVVRFPRIA